MSSYKSVLVLLMAFAVLTGAPALTAAAESSKFAVIDVDALINQSTAGKSMQEQLKVKREEFQKEFSKHEKELADADKAISEKKSSLSPEELAKERQAFEANLLETRKLFQQRRTALDKGLGEAMQSLRKEIVQASAEVAEAKGYHAVLMRESVVIVEKDLDITADVLKKLNEKVKTIKVKVE